MRAYAYVWNRQEHRRHPKLGEVHHGLVSRFRLNPLADGKRGNGLVDGGGGAGIGSTGSGSRGSSVSWCKRNWLQAGEPRAARSPLLRSGGLKVRLAQVDCVGEFKGKGSGRVFGNDQR